MVTVTEITIKYFIFAYDLVISKQNNSNGIL